MRKLMLAVFLILLNNVVFSQNPFEHGTKIALQADNGLWLQQFYPNTFYSLNTTGTNSSLDVSIPVLKEEGAREFEVIEVGGGKVALRESKNNIYLITCSSCIQKCKKSRTLLFNGDSYRDPKAQFKPIKLSNGKYALQTSDGYYVARCYDCVEDIESYAPSHILTAHVSSSDPVYAQFKVVIKKKSSSPGYSKITVKNNSVQKNWFKVAYKGYDGNVESQEVYLEAGKSKTFTLINGGTQYSISGQALDVSQWKKIFSVENTYIEGGKTLCYSINSKLFSSITGGACK